MAESIGAVRVDIIGNAEDLKVEVARAKTLVASMGPEFEKSYAKMNESQKRATLATLKFEQTIGKSRDEIKLLSLAARGAAPEALEKLRLSMLRTRDAAGSTNTLLGAQSKAFAGSNKTARELQFAMRGLPAQITDIGVSLASGQRPMMVFLQQGGQLKDLFGGIRPAAAALAGAIRGMINPFTVGAVAVGGFALAVKQATDEAFAFNRALIKTGEYAGLTATQLQDMAADLDKVSGVTRHSAAAALAAVMETGRITGDQFELVARAVTEWSVATGESVDSVVQEFVRLADDPLKAIESLDKSQHFLTDSTRKMIEALVEQGKHAEAVRVATEAYANTLIDRAPKVVENLGYIQSAWLGIKNLANEAWDAMLGVGREKTPREALQAQLDEIDERMFRRQDHGGWGYTEEEEEKRRQLRAQIAVLDAMAFLDRPLPKKDTPASSGGTGGVEIRSNAQRALNTEMEETLSLAEQWEILDREVYGPAAIEAHNRRVTAWAKEGEAVERATESMSVYADQAARNMQSAFADFLFDPFKNGVDGMVESFGKALRRMAAEAMATRILQSLGIMGGATLGGESAGTIADLYSGGSFFFNAKGGVYPNSGGAGFPPPIGAFDGAVVQEPVVFRLQAPWRLRGIE